MNDIKGAVTYCGDEYESVKRDATSSEGKSFEERTAMFLSLMELVDAIQSNLTPTERLRRRQIADRIDPRPDPWWRNFSEQALAEYESQTSST